MRHRSVTICAIVFSAALSSVSCVAEDISAEIAKQYVASNGASVNLAQAYPAAWERVCILGPYSNNADAKEALGFDWDAQGKTSILVNEGISVLLFIHSGQVVKYVQHPRNKGDFSNLTKSCYARDSAVFVHNLQPKSGWPGLFPKGGA